MGWFHPASELCLVWTTTCNLPELHLRSCASATLQTSRAVCETTGALGRAVPPFMLGHGRNHYDPS